MVLGKWGTVWRFVVLAGGIGGLGGVVTMVLLLLVPQIVTGDGMSIGPVDGFLVATRWALGIGIGLGVVMGIPCSFVVRRTAPRLHGRLSAVVFCFVLGFAAALTPVMLVSLASGSFVRPPPIAVWEYVLSLASLSLPAGILTALASPLIFAPAETPARTRTVP
ncbi:MULTISPECIES: hypothetical protein [Brevibacterium]|jgi:hypothetical protein|uniref:Uncharacterized protein n=1 Tax=Brevibacterium casei TaxID=33889 RepID=A0A7T4DIE1_9MICO|nr:MULTISPECIES: hypothetical protein [Brevibacterium]QQB14452.1 hypothetical protein I6H47_00085 [Brevibacterium casei]